MLNIIAVKKVHCCSYQYGQHPGDKNKVLLINYRVLFRERVLRVLFHYFEQFVAEYEYRYGRECGYFLPIVREVVEKYLDCSNPKNGFVRICCSECGTERLLP